MFFWNSLAFSMIQQMLVVWSLIPLPFLNSARTSGSLWFTYCGSLAWKILSISSLVWDRYSCAVVWTFFRVIFLWDWNENWPFPVLSYSSVSYKVQALVSITHFRKWSSSDLIETPLLPFLFFPRSHRVYSVFCHSALGYERYLCYCL